ncbi:methyltransferase domain-containing protein [Actinoplanes sp. TBRC 11911]|nr:methyltransferase domain-containing protein [Actinoplanes sp. TBRC 11911]
MPHAGVVVGLDPSLRFLRARPPAPSTAPTAPASRAAADATPGPQVAADTVPVPSVTDDPAPAAPVTDGPAPAPPATDDPAARVNRVAGDAAALPFADRVFDAVVSGLALNFVPRPEAAVAEFARVARPGAVVAAYVWDYAEGMQMIRHFWDVAADLDPAAEALDEGRRFPICHAPALAEAWMAAGLRRVTTTKIEIPTVFRSFDDFWHPFLGGQGPAPAYLAAQPPDRREAIRQALATRLGPNVIALTAGAWAVRGFKDI